VPVNPIINFSRARLLKLWVPEPSHVDRENAFVQQHYYGYNQHYSAHKSDVAIILLPLTGDFIKTKAQLVAQLVQIIK